MSQFGGSVSRRSQSSDRPGLARAHGGKLGSLLGGEDSSEHCDDSCNESFQTEGGNSFEIEMGASNHSTLRRVSGHSGKKGSLLDPPSLNRRASDGLKDPPSLNRRASDGSPSLSRKASDGSKARSSLGGNPQAPFTKSGSRHNNRGGLGTSLHNLPPAGRSGSLHSADGGVAQLAMKQRDSVTMSTGLSGGSGPSNRRGSMSGGSGGPPNRRGSLTGSLHGGNLSTSVQGGLDKMWPKSAPLGPLAAASASRKSRRSTMARQKSVHRKLATNSGHKWLEEDGNESMASITAQRNVPYFEKLCQICEEIEYPHEYADIVGSQFLGLDGASPVTHVDGHVPTINELVEFLSMAFICITNFSDLSLIFVDDFQWVDSFTWKIFRELCERGKKMLLICAMRSHDKQALRRLSTAITQSHMQSQMIEISLGPLDLLEIREMIAKVLGYGEDAVDESLCSDIYQKTGGLPVYVAELLENIKRNKTVTIDDDGVLRWTAQAEQEQKGMASKYNSSAVMEETFLSRFDALDVRVRKVLQTCAVLGLSFSLSDVVRVHPELEEVEIENALDNAVEEIILVERFEDEDESVSSGNSGSTGCDSDSRSGIGNEMGRDNSAGSTDMEMEDMDDRFFEFSHAMWRQKVLTTMLKDRKIELHRLIAEAMERDQVHILEQCDISRLLTLFDHWKACGDFCKAAPLALAVGSRLEEWDLAMQSLDLYRDALEMSFESVEAVDENGGRDGKLTS